MTYAVFRKQSRNCGEQPGREFFRRRVRDFGEKTATVEQGNATAGIAGIEGKEKHRVIIPQRGRKRRAIWVPHFDQAVGKPFIPNDIP